jgi:hypothetical protein
MAEQLVPCVISLPFVDFGKVAGELTVRRAWLDDSTQTGQAISVRARIPRDQLASFRTWLSKEIGEAATLEVTE